MIAVDRYRLTSPRLTLEKGPRGLSVDGGGILAFCGCESPPVTFGFRSALVAPPTDLLLTQPTLRLGSVPVLWLPYLWLRTPERAGLLPIRVAHRGADGPLVGSGVHVPVGGSRLDLAAAAYTQGGVDTEVSLTTKRSTTRLRWDWLHESLVTANLAGAWSTRRSGSVAWTADALRGPRALRGPVLLEEVSLRQDRARAVVGFSDGATTAGIGALADARRGGAVSGAFVAGPSSYAGFGGRVGDHGLAHADASIATARLASGLALTQGAVRADARLESAWGPVHVSAEAQGRGAATLQNDARGFTSAVGGRAEVATPLVKEFGPSSDPAEHWIVPFLSGTAGVLASRTPAVLEPVAPSGPIVGATSGFRTTWGRIAGDRAAISASAAGSWIAHRGGSVPVGTVSAGGRVGVASSRMQIVRPFTSPDSVVAIAQVGLGEGRGPFVTGRLVGARSNVPVVTRLAAGSGWDAPWVAWLDREGWTTGGSFGIPWTRWLATRMDGDYDISQRTLLGVRGSLSYLHPCRCLAVAVWSGARLGRRSPDLPDSWVTVDIAP